MKRSIAEYEAVCFLYDEIDPLIMEKATPETRSLIQPAINLLKIELKDRSNDELEKRRAKNDR